MASVMTTLGHVNRAIDFFSKPDKYFAIGRTTPWPDENNPPNPTGNETSVEEVIGYKAVTEQYFVKPDPNANESNGGIYYRGQWYAKTTDPNEAKSGGYKWVYLSTIIAYDELPLQTYRQVGVYVGLQKAKGVDKSNLLPSEVADPGTLEVIDNRKPQYRSIDQREKLSVIIEF